MSDRPRIVVTLHGPEQAAREEPTWASFDGYLDAVRRAGGDPIALDPTTSHADRDAALAAMDGLLLPGGADLDPALYGEAPHPSVAVEGARDDLELAAWTAARERGVPIFGVCRGFQAINVFSGGRLVQHLEGHDSSTVAPEGHPLHLEPESRLAAILGETEPLLRTEVNSYHHQAVRPSDLAPGLVASAVAPHHEGNLVEALEPAEGDDWLIGVQFHPERSEFIGPEFDRLWRAFVDAARQVRST
ncbi:MAG TPA: gamma-glutamyl-gamma-aminobutyrate hydrolase family protein [Methylomirabilota bacterium]|nr:gamma-glutamyl-gamma-aminobutyrate hydrolase family protein [Methylomirabilota bacterium]